MKVQQSTPAVHRFAQPPACMSHALVERFAIVVLCMTSAAALARAEECGRCGVVLRDGHLHGDVTPLHGDVTPLHDAHVWE